MVNDGKVEQVPDSASHMDRIITQSTTETTTEITLQIPIAVCGYLSLLSCDLGLHVCQPVLSIPQATDTVVNNVDIRQGQEQESANLMNRLTTKTITETTTETTEVTTLQIPIAVSGS